MARIADALQPEGEGDAGHSSVEVTIHRLRAKMERDPKTPQYLLSYRGQGYMLATS